MKCFKALNMYRKFPFLQRDKKDNFTFYFFKYENLHMITEKNQPNRTNIIVFIQNFLLFQTFIFIREKITLENLALSNQPHGMC